MLNSLILLAKKTTESNNMTDTLALITLVLSSGVVAAIVSGLFNLYSLKMTKSFQEKIEHQNNNANEKIQKYVSKQNNKATAANLKASSRIEWIENVRSVYSELIGAYYESIRKHENNEEVDFKDLEKLTSQLVLYFGTDNNSVLFKNVYIERDFKLSDKILKKLGLPVSSTENYGMSDIHRPEDTNVGKNDFIVLYLKELLIFYTDFIEKVYNESKQVKFDAFEKEIRDSSNTDSTIRKIGNELFLSKNLSINQVHKCIDEVYYSQHQEIIVKDRLNKLTDVMRLYLRIEWKRAIAND